MSFSSAAILVARREVAVLLRSRAARGSFLVLAAVAWLPVVLVPLRAGALGIASYTEATPLILALGGVVLPLVALLAGTDLLAGEEEDGTLAQIVTLPISRNACFAGKTIARAGLLGVSYLAAFSSAALIVAGVRGTAGLSDFTAVALAGLLLCLACGGIGTWLGAAGRGRVRAYGAALLCWLLLALALDAVLLATVVALAPPPPTEVGTHGHGELQPPSIAPHDSMDHTGGAHTPATTSPSSLEGQKFPIHDPHARHGGDVDAEPAAPFTWLLLLNPVDLYRLSALTTGSGLRQRLQLGLPDAGPAKLALPLIAGWVIWLVIPPLLGLRRFRRAVLF